MSLLINEDILGEEVRLIDETGKQIGVVSKFKALDQATRLGLDLVLITDSEIPVCKIIDADKYFYENKKKEKEIAKKQREAIVETKEIRLRPVTDKHDIEIKCRKIKEFLLEGDKVKISVRFKGREAAHKDIGRTVLQSIIDQVNEAKIERHITDGGREMFIILSPNNDVK